VLFANSFRKLLSQVRARVICLTGKYCNSFAPVQLSGSRSVTMRAMQGLTRIGFPCGMGGALKILKHDLNKQNISKCHFLAVPFS
jgi:hypothetical protein